VTIAVPGERADAVARLDAELHQRLRDLLGAQPGIAVGVAVDIALDPARHDFRVAMVEGGVLDELLDQERSVLHQAEHGGISSQAKKFVIWRLGAICPRLSAIL